MEALPDLIRQGDLGVVPNRCDLFTDGILPTKLMEYVSLGVPVVAARTTAITSYFDDTMVRFFTPGNVEELADAILALYHDPGQRAAYAENAARFHERYNWPAIAADYVGTLERLDGGGDPTR
jgi:glycosyltransferase involved in cell wall biosynthesis